MAGRAILLPTVTWQPWRKKVGARLVFDTDSHSPSDLTDDEKALKIVLGAGLTKEDFEDMQANARALVERIRNDKA